MRRFKVLGLMLITNLVTLPVHAFNTDFLTFTPVSHFTKQDWKIAGEASQEALEHAKDGKKVIWQNPQTGASGYFLPSHTQGNCRYLKIFNKAHGMTSITQYKFCKMNGDWKAV